MTTGKVVNCSTPEEYYEALEAAQNRLVVVDCYADWCGPCRAMAPVFEALSIQYSGVTFVKVDIDQVPSVKNMLGVWALPTFVYVKRGKKLSSFTGANERTLRRGLENNGDVGYCASCVIA